MLLLQLMSIYKACYWKVKYILKYRLLWMNVLLVVQVLMLAKTARKQGYIYVLNSPVIRSEAMFQKQMLFSTIWCPKLH